MCGPQDPLFTPLLQFARVPFQAKGSVHKTPLLRKFENFSLYSLNFYPPPPLFSSQAPKFGNFQLTSPQIWKFSVHKPPFSEASISSQAPNFWNLGRTPLPEKSWVPPPGSHPHSVLTPGCVLSSKSYVPAKPWNFDFLYTKFFAQLPIHQYTIFNRKAPNFAQIRYFLE